MEQVETPQSPRFCALWGNKVEVLDTGHPGHHYVLQRVLYSLTVGTRLEKQLCLFEGDGMLPNNVTGALLSKSPEE